MEYDQQQERLNPKQSKINSPDNSSNAAVLKLKKELYGSIRIEEMEFSLQEEFTRSDLKVSPIDWNGLDAETKGKCIAVEIVKDRIEFIRRIHDTMERNKKSALNDRPKKNS